MYTIRKEFHFSASHILNGLNDGHPCGRLHGHNYKVTVELKSDTLDSTSFVQDYGDLNPIKNYIDGKLDHQHLNNVWPGMQPSAENIAQKLFQSFKPAFPMLNAIEVCETPKTVARYEQNE